MRKRATELVIRLPIQSILMQRVTFISTKYYTCKFWRDVISQHIGKNVDVEATS